MRLTLTLLKRRHVIPGNKWIGKHKLPPVAYPWNVERYAKRLKIEEENMFYLRHPYITPEQEFGHAQALNKKVDWLQGKKLLSAAHKVQKSVTMESVIGHLNVNSKWEF